MSFPINGKNHTHSYGMLYKTTASLILPSSITLTHEICDEQWQLLSKHSTFHLILTLKTRVSALVTTCYLNSALRDSIYCRPVSLDTVFIMIISLYAANIELHRLSLLESNCPTCDFYISPSLSERFQFLFQTSDHYAVKYRTFSATLGFNITDSLV